MKICLERITPDDKRTTADLEPGEIVMHEVELNIDGQPRTFAVYLKANVLHDLNAGVVYGDRLVEELLRFEPAGLNRLYRAVAKRRRGELLALPLVLIDAEPGRGKTPPRKEEIASHAGLSELAPAGRSRSRRL